jgi:hypothetical protein
MSISKITHPDAVHPEWVREGRVHKYFVGKTLAGSVNLSAPGIKPILYTWTIVGRGETGVYKDLKHAKKAVELVIFERVLDRHVKKAS